MQTELHIQLSPTFSPPYATGYMYTCTEDKRRHQKPTQKHQNQTSLLKLPYCQTSTAGGWEEGHDSWRRKCRSQQPIHNRKEKSPSSKPHPELRASAYLMLESPRKHPFHVTPVTRAWADSFCIICMANQPQVLSAPSRSSAGRLEEPLNSPKRNTIPTPSLSRAFTQIVCLQTNPALK